MLGNRGAGHTILSNLSNVMAELVLLCVSAEEEVELFMECDRETLPEG
jgi:hypothetical protein